MMFPVVRGVNKAVHSNSLSLSPSQFYLQLLERQTPQAHSLFLSPKFHPYGVVILYFTYSM